MNAVAAATVAAAAAAPRFLMLTPAGAMHAFADERPDAVQDALRTLVAAPQAPPAMQWLAQDRTRAGWLDDALRRGWIERVARRASGPKPPLEAFLPHVIAGLSGARRAALGSDAGFCLAAAGFDADEAETLCAAAADLQDFVRRQRRRGWRAAPGTVSFHDHLSALMPTHTFVPFWIDATGYCLVLGDEPLLNHRAFVELVWGLQLAGRRFAAIRA